MQVIKDSACNSSTSVLHGFPDTEIYGKNQKIFPRYPGKNETEYEKKIFLPNLLPFEEYNKIIVLFSAGKDSTASYFRLIEMGVPKEKIELWHHDIDGNHPDRRMDWPVTKAYTEAFSKAEGVKLRRSYRLNGFWGEVYRVGASYPIQYEDGGEIKTCELSQKQIESDQIRQEILRECNCDEYELLKDYGYRRKFPAKSGDLSRRWCSVYLKISVANAVLRNLDDLKAKSVLDRVC